MNDTIEKKRLDILNILQSVHEPLSSQLIKSKLTELGYRISERTVRFDLLNLDNEGFTEYIRKKGRIVTRKGREELSKARIYEKVGFLSAKIDRMTYLMSFNLNSLKGTIVLNLSLVRQQDVKAAVPLILKMFKTPYTMGKLMTLFFPGEDRGEFPIPEGFVGFGTVCSITLNGILLAEGIPTRSRFGGLLELEAHHPTRFVAVINYDGTSLDPLEIYIKSALTNYLGAADNGNGIVGTSFREFPGESHHHLREIRKKLQTLELDGFLSLGYPGKPLCEIPVNDGILGALIMGGLNTIGILEEAGIKIQSKALAGLVDFKKLFHYRELEQKLKASGIY